MGYAFCVKKSDQFMDILAQFQDRPELGFGDVQHHHMNLAAVFRKMGGDLGADEDSRQVADFQGAIDGVMVADGDEVHAAIAGGAIQVVGRGVAFRDIELAHGPVGRFVGVAGMDVQIGFVWLHAGYY